MIISGYNDTRPSFQALNMVLWQVSIVTMALVVWGTHGIQVKVGERGWPFALIIPTEIPYATGIIYNCFQRVGWSLSLSWIIFSCAKGYGGKVYPKIISLVNSIFSIFMFFYFQYNTNYFILINNRISQRFFVMGIFCSIIKTDVFHVPDSPRLRKNVLRLHGLYL